MASKQAMLAALIAIPTVARAAEHIVGGDVGWTVNFDYTTWADGKDFRVGDTLVFKYTSGQHNVYRVTGPAFKACMVPPANESEPLTSGNDVIALSTPGRRWYICGVGDGKHCEAGQKLVINVRQAAWEAPAPSPPAMARWGPASSPAEEGMAAWAPSPSAAGPAPSMGD